ncbi:hypothetical protein [Cupriavidus alkaliphilus]|uniref:hypothetical protein n=1 Tax=Cupriavidus alkaliphilus TaxID=942866 RepID=UPI001621F2C1|nr:hypothetical protein [Cupriavidus alkaliphilus]MBB2918652.1 hypothetical protein [Cupriavidus alkaliphilus]
MSGPKVVRIVTREEILAICEGQLRQLDQAITQWTAQCGEMGELSDAEASATRERRRVLAELLKQDAFIDLQKRVPEEIAFLKADALRRERLAIERAAAARQRGRRGQENAATLLNVLKARGTNVPDELKKQLESIACGEGADHVDALLAQGFNLLATEQKSALTAAQRDLANRLAEPNEGQSFEAWKARNKPTSPVDMLLERVDAQIAEAETILGREETATYLTRLRSMESEPNEARRKLLLDSLILDVSKGIETARVRRSAIEQLAEIAVQIEPFISEASTSLRAQAAACTGATPISTLTALVEQCQTLLESELRRKAAEARREVILQGLAQLGYEVHEGMATAWATDGRVVLRKSSLPGYGVEIGGQAESSRLQVRAVALTSDRDTNRDKDVETIWCGEFARLQQLVTENGNGLLIERAMGIGQVPLKVVDDTRQISESIDNRKLSSRRVI